MLYYYTYYRPLELCENFYIALSTWVVIFHEHGQNLPIYKIHTESTSVVENVMIKKKMHDNDNEYQ